MGCGPAGPRAPSLPAQDWRLYIVQEYCDGGPLRKLVQSGALWPEAGPSLVAICEVALELAQALAHLHSKSIIHGGEGGGAGRARERPFACALLPTPPTSCPLPACMIGRPSRCPLGWLHLRVGNATCSTLVPRAARARAPVPAL